MDRVKRRLTLFVLIAGGIACISIALAIPPLVPILVPVGSVMLGGGFGMFQSIIKATGDSNADNNGANNAEHTQTQNVCEHNSEAPQSVNILFQYNQYGDRNSTQETDPKSSVKPRRPLMLV